MELLVTILSKLGCNLLRGLTTYLYRGQINYLLISMDILVPYQLVQVIIKKTRFSSGLKRRVSKKPNQVNDKFTLGPYI